MEENIFDEVIKVNLGGTFLVNQVTANAMKEFKINGSIVNISSIAGTYKLL
jgi:17beta-estradiol 17-dehydrogenase/3alpha(17beta)-hydroxysteroid dehydrogenase (NAD+)